MESLIVALHGFWGQPSDWDFLGRDLTAPSRVFAPDLFSDVPDSWSGLDWSEWGQAFGREIIARDPSCRRILVGYSMGGRMALAALRANPSLWQGAVLISTHPGLASVTEQRQRGLDDAAWAERFLSWPEPDILQAWEAQPILSSGHDHRSGIRLASNQRRPLTVQVRARLAAALSDWSLAKQIPVADWGSTVTCPVLWLAGRCDEKFVPLAEEGARAMPNGRLTILPGAGHRLLHERPHEVADAIIRALTAESVLDPRP